MLTLEDLVRFVSRKSNISMVRLILVIFLLMPLAGCSGEGGGGPTISSLSPPTDDATGSDSDQDPNAETLDSGVGHSDGEDGPVITMTPTPMGVTAHLNWDPPADINAAGYNIYYGKRSPEEPSSEESGSEEVGSEEVSAEEPNSCARGENQAVEAPAATITGLEPNTRYFFAIRAFNDSDSICSNEITAVTPSAQS